MSTALNSSDLHDGVNQLSGIDFDVITNTATVQPFLMSVASVSDFWLYLGSQGGITAGRRNPDHALFPYYTEDKLVDLSATVGACTSIWIAGEPQLWRVGDAAPAGRSWVMKAINGDEVVFGQAHQAGLEFRQSWRVSPRYGLVRSCTLTNTGSSPRQLRLLDGLRGILPAGVTQRTQNELSVLLDAYKRSEVTPDGFGVYSLSSAMTDLAEPAESLQASVAWRLGPPAECYLASAEQVAAFDAGLPVSAAPDARGVRSAQLAVWSLELAPGESSSWTVVADTGLDSAAVSDLLADFRSGGLAAALAADLVAARDALAELLAAADGYQATGDVGAAAHHRSSVLFNLLRGGTFRDGNLVTKEGFERHLRLHAPGAFERLAAARAELPDQFPVGHLLDWGRRTGCPDAERLSLTYLPLSFGRRHGDPSRPWNRFDIVLTDEAGEPVTGYQGNWRDVFQNWEALSWSFPEFTESMVAVFLNATTVDGYNPYRITHLGIDWEEPEPENPWSNIGYWGDHQIVYLHRLLDLSQRRHHALTDLVNRPIFTTADVPYRIVGFDQILADPANTIVFDEAANRVARGRQATEGADGLLRHTSDGELFRTGLGDKLLTLLAAKLVNFVPDGGIWMNTQRPEWNDANNALAGPGLSVVTMAQLLPFVELLAELLAGDVLLRPELAQLLVELSRVLAEPPPAEPLQEARRAQLVHALGRAGEQYRAAAYRSESAEQQWLPGAEVRALLLSARTWLRQSVLNSRRADGLFHSYNTIQLGPAGISIGHLPLMLEGQVAVLASGLLEPAEGLAMLDSLRRSALYRADQHSYLLYPDKELPGFLAKNRIPDSYRSALGEVAADPEQRVIRVGRDGGLHFAPTIRNARVLAEALAEVLADPAVETPTTDPEQVLAAHEATFQHASFTGRSGTFFAYEGLGSIYWHMVAKLVLATRETLDRAIEAGDPAAAGLQQAYRDLRDGLGYAKDASTFGAFPTDAYSHTPRHAGARQPGMTGQVKEDVITRFTELGVSVDGGELSLDPSRVAASDWLTEPATLAPPGMRIELAPGELGFTICGVPVVYRGLEPRITAETVAGEQVISGTTLPAWLTAQVFARDGSVSRLLVG